MENRLYFATTLLRERLLRDERIRALVGENIFPCVANDRTEGDFIVLRRVRYDRLRSKQGIASNGVMMELAIVSENYDRSIEIAFLVDLCMERDGLEGLHGAELIELIGSYEEFDDFKYVQILEYQID